MTAERPGILIGISPGYRRPTSIYSFAGGRMTEERTRELLHEPDAVVDEADPAKRKIKDRDDPSTVIEANEAPEEE